MWLCDDPTCLSDRVIRTDIPHPETEEIVSLYRCVNCDNLMSQPINLELKSTNNFPYLGP